MQQYVCGQRALGLAVLVVASRLQAGGRCRCCCDCDRSPALRTLCQVCVTYTEHGLVRPRMQLRGPLAMLGYQQYMSTELTRCYTVPAHHIQWQRCHLQRLWPQQTCPGAEGHRPCPRLFVLTILPRAGKAQQPQKSKHTKWSAAAIEVHKAPGSQTHYRKYSCIKGCIHRDTSRQQRAATAACSGIQA